VPDNIRSNNSYQKIYLSTVFKKPLDTRLVITISKPFDMKSGPNHPTIVGPLLGLLPGLLPVILGGGGRVVAAAAVGTVP
jgi:hypothetical protein